MFSEGRAQIIANLIRNVGPAAAGEIVRDANERHRQMNLGDCGKASCPVCVASPSSRVSPPANSPQTQEER